MTETSVPPITVAIVDRDRIFSLGLQAWTSECLGRDQAVTVELFDRVAPLLKRLEDVPIALAIVGDLPTPKRTYQSLCERNVRVLALVETLTPAVRDQLQAIGVRGACHKTTDADRMVMLMREVLADREAWKDLDAASLQGGLDLDQLTGLAYVNVTLARIERRLERSGLSQLERWFLEGQRREVLAARWIVRRVFASRSASTSNATPEPVTDRPDSIASDPLRSATASSSIPSDRALDRLPSKQALSAPAEIRALCIDRVLTRLQGETRNLSGRPLEIDILSPEKRRELLAIVLRRFDDALSEAVTETVTVDRLYTNRDRLLLDLWNEAAFSFFGYYRTVAINGQTVAVIDAVLEGRDTARKTILDRIPFFPELLASLVCGAPLVVDNTTYAAGSSEACIRAQMLLENVLVHVANAIVQPLLEQFGDIESIKRDFYDRRLLSTREIERFRNDLSWRYRWQTYVSDPTAIYESRHQIYVLGDLGIRYLSIYAPRRHELSELGSFQQAVTLVLEGRDALAPRVRQVVSIVGSGLVYVLTQVVGRGLGLIGRGILDGIGNAKLDRPARHGNGRRDLP
jgi:DNA-binding NarL/FixJ family response regulator